MAKKLFGLNLDIELKVRLDKMAKDKYTNTSNLANQIFAKVLDEHEGIVKDKKEIVDNTIRLTDEQRIADWEWRKTMVAQGKFPVHMGDEYPREPEDSLKHVYLNPSAIKEPEVQIRNDF
jgi:hypothetical protein